MDNKSMINLSKRLIGAGIALPHEIKGCSTTQLEEVRGFAKTALPSMYENFLSIFGNGAGQFFVGTDIFYPDILTNREAAEDLLKEDQSSFQLTPSDFVFACHQGYQFMFMPLSDLDNDPPVYYYMEGSEGPVKRWEHFSEFLLNAVEDYERLSLS